MPVGFKQFFMFGRISGVCPMVSLGRSGPLLAEVRVQLWLLPSSVTWVSFPGGEVGWEGAVRGRAWHLCISSPDKVRARPGWELRETATPVSSGGSLGGVWPVITLCKLGYPGLLPALVLQAKLGYGQLRHEIAFLLQCFSFHLCRFLPPGF